MLGNARKQAYTKENIMSAWRGSGLILPNSRAVLIKLPTYREKGTSAISAPPPVPPTSRNSKGLLHQAQQAKLLLKFGSSLSSEQQVELVNLIDSMERFTIGTFNLRERPTGSGEKHRSWQLLMTAEGCRHQLLVVRY